MSKDRVNSQPDPNDSESVRVWFNQVLDSFDKALDRLIEAERGEVKS